MLGSHLGPGGDDCIEFIKRGQAWSKFFSEDGQWNAGIPLPRPSSLEESEDGLEGHEKELFMKFVRKMLQSAPEDRSTARELLEDEWLNSPDEG